MQRMDGGGGGRSGERRAKGFWKTVDIHGTDGSTVVGMTISSVCVVVAVAVVPTSTCGIVERVSPFRLLARPHHLPLSLWGDDSRSQTHGREAGAGTSVIPRPGGQPQTVADRPSPPSSTLQYAPAAPLT